MAAEKDVGVGFDAGLGGQARQVGPGTFTGDDDLADVVALAGELDRGCGYCSFVLISAGPGFGRFARRIRLCRTGGWRGPWRADRREASEHSPRHAVANMAPSRVCDSVPPMMTTQVSFGRAAAGTR